jgi:hypothetical protein
VYDETLARCTRAVYRPRFSPDDAKLGASVFVWLWLGHMYMGIKGLPMHSPQRPVYGGPLHPCGLPPRFLWTTAHRWASVFLWVWLGHMYMGSKGLPMHSPPSSVYGENLARCTRVVYSPRFLWTVPSWGASVFLWLWLGHMYMGSKGLPMQSARNPVYDETLARCTRVVYPPRFL